MVHECPEMAEAPKGHSGRCQEAQCYNCGSLGHWAVACPEATRETPAGLAAWRKSSSSGQGNARSHHSGPRRSKAPVITKYAPPVPPHQPHQLAPGMGHYEAPLAPVAGSHLGGFYAPSNTPYQHYGIPAPQLSNGYHQGATYAYQSQQYGLSASYGLPPYRQSGLGSGHGMPLAPPPPPPPTAPPPAPPGPVTGGSAIPASFHSSGHGAGDHRSYPQAYSPHPPPTYASHEPPPYPRVSASSPPSAAALPKPPVARISHPLPPKPPLSHDQMKPQRDHRNRRKQDRHSHHHDRRFRDYRSSSNSHPVTSRNSMDVSVSNFGSPSKDLSTHDQIDRIESESKSEKQTPHMSHSPSPDRIGDTNGRATASEVSLSQTPADAPNPVSSDSGDAKESEQEPPHLRHDVARPSVEGLDAAPPVCQTAASADDAAGKFVADDTVVHESKASDEKEDGEIASEDSIESSGPQDEAPAEMETSSPDTKLLESKKRRRSYESNDEVYDDDDDDDSDSDKRETKRSRLDDGAFASGRCSEYKSTKENIWNTLGVPRQADRKRRGSACSRGSRVSSVSSNTSDLDSLEAELLGRTAKKQKQQDPSSPRRQRLEREHKAPSKPKRRQTAANSAYSRRW